MLDVYLPGTGGVMPLPERFLACCALRMGGRTLLIDCGEGTQVALRSCALTFKPIDVICFTHFHADHISGLAGLLLSMGNGGREAPVTLIGPKGLELVTACLRVIAPALPFPLRFVELPEEGQEIEAGDFSITAFPAKHGVPCYGYKVSVRRAGRFDPQKARENAVPMKLWSVLQKQPAAGSGGKVYTSGMVLGAPRRGLTVCYITDTRPRPEFADFARNADLLICEGMYAGNDMLRKAEDKGHMLFSEAAEIARDAGAQKLWLTHFSPSLPDPENYVENARTIFPETVYGTDGMLESLSFKEDT